MTIWTLAIELRPELFAYARSIADTADEAEELVADAMERGARVVCLLDPRRHMEHTELAFVRVGGQREQRMGASNSRRPQQWPHLCLFTVCLQGCEGQGR